MGEIAFLTLFIGLVTGQHTIQLDVPPGISSAVLELDGQSLARLGPPRWEASVDLGDEPRPRELVAIGYDAKGGEISRTSTTLNVPAAVAYVEIALTFDHSRAVVAALRWHHIHQVDPESATIRFDGRRLKTDRERRANLPSFDASVPHVISAEVRFPDGVTARRERVLTGTAGHSESTDTQLTAVVVAQLTPDERPLTEGCFSSDGRPLRATATEKGEALALFVRDYDSGRLRSAFAAENASWGDWTSRHAARQVAPLDADTVQRLMFTAPNTYFLAGREAEATTIFAQSADSRPVDGGVLWLLTRPGSPKAAKGPGRVADAVATAGVAAMSQQRRRAVILVLGDETRAGRYSAQVVRRYLASIGAPLLVWSTAVPTSEQRARWGDIADISTNAALTAATNHLREVLATQRVVWLAAPPVTALRATARETCGIRPVAHW